MDDRLSPVSKEITGVTNIRSLVTVNESGAKYVRHTIDIVLKDIRLTFITT